MGTARGTLRGYLGDASVRRAAADGARVVVWPEYGVFVGAADRDRLRKHVAALSRATGAVVVGGWIDVAAGQNRALLAAPDGGVVDYVKRCLVPVAESTWLAPGAEPFAALGAGGLRLGAVVCCDLDYPDGPRAAARGGRGARRSRQGQPGQRG